MPPDPAPINALRDQYSAAYNANDAAAVANLYADDAVSMGNHQATLEGKQAIQAYLQGQFEQNTVAMTISPQETEIAGDWAYDRGTFTITLTPKAKGKAAEDAGRYIVVLKKQADGSWKVYREIDNSSNPMPGM
jgi:uncharacterized protein (TIGR02246 family)